MLGLFKKKEPVLNKSKYGELQDERNGWVKRKADITARKKALESELTDEITIANSKRLYTIKSYKRSIYHCDKKLKDLKIAIMQEDYNLKRAYILEKYNIDLNKIEL